ncbi:MAG: DUF3006 domain-containing protein [Patescibacteria group bacterium]
MHDPVLEVVLDRFESDYAVLRVKDAKEILWPRRALPADAREGSVLYLQALSNKEKEAEREAIAKTLLNEVLKNGS